MSRFLTAYTPVNVETTSCHGVKRSVERMSERSEVDIGSSHAGFCWLVSETKSGVPWNHHEQFAITRIILREKPDEINIKEKMTLK